MNVKGLVISLSVGLLLAGCGGSSSSGTINVRTVNFVRGSTSVNVSAQTAQLGTALSYGVPTAYSSLSNFPQTLSAIDTASSANLGTLSLNATGGDFYTLYVFGVESGSPVASLELLQDAQPAISAVAATIRVGNFSSTVPGGANVDVYITPTSAQSLNGLTPQFANVPFGTVVAYQQMSGAAYTVWVTPTGLPNQVLKNGNFTFSNGNDYSVYVDDATTAGTSPWLIVVPDTY